MYTGFWIDNDHIYGPTDSGRFWIQDDYICRGTRASINA